MKNNFRIKIHGDYHEIMDTKIYKSIELGCFPTKGEMCNNYFGLYYKGRKPAIEKILNSLFRKIEFSSGLTHFYTGKNISISKEDVICDVIKALKTDKKQ